MRFSTDYAGSFFDLHEADAHRLAACKADFRAGLTAMFGRLGAANDRADSAAAALWAEMTQPHRHYHTPVHVLGMFDWADRLGVTLGAADILAIWYHDAVWSPGADGDANERASAAWLAREAQTLNLEPAAARRAVATIKWTARHTEPAVPPEHALVMDLDLAGFAAEPSVFALQSRAVRAELPALDDRSYAEGTLKLFEALLARDRIYRSEPAAVLETPARRQLEREIERLAATM